MTNNPLALRAEEEAAGVALPSAGLSLGAIAVEAAFVALILSRNPRGRTSRAYLVLMVSFVIWNAGEALARLFPDAPPGQLSLWLKVQWTGLVLLPGTILFFALTYPEPSRLLRRPWALPLIFLPSLVFALLVWFDLGLTRGIIATPLGPDLGTGPLYPPSFVAFFSLLALADFRLGRMALLHRREPEGRSALLLFLGLAHTHVLGILTDAMLPLFSGYVRSGVGSIYNLDFAAFAAYTVYRYRFLVLEPAREATYPREPGLPLKEGYAQAILSGDKGAAYAGFRALAARVPAICVTATPPAVLARRYQLDRTPVLWVTRLQDQPRAIRPAELKFEGLQALAHALRQTPSMAILLDDVDYVALTLGFPETIGLLKTLYDRCSQAGATLVIPLNPAAWEPRELALLVQVLDDAEELPARPPAPPANPLSVLAVGSRAWGWALAGPPGDGGALVVTPLHPAKFRGLVGSPGVDVLWLTDGPGEGAVPPVGLDLGLARAVRRWMADHPGAAVLLDGLDYLLAINPLPEVVELVKGLVDAASLRGVRIVFGLRGEAAAARALALLGQRCEAVLVEGGPGSGGRSPAG